jgi:hypothetical protein
MLLLYWGVRALGIVNHLRRRFARFKLGAHLLKARCQGFDLLVLLREFTGGRGVKSEGRVAQTLIFVGWNRGILKEVTR